MLERLTRFVATWVLLIPLSILYGQSLATVQGRVTDPSGGVVPRATVQVLGQSSKAARVARSNGEGTFRISGLAPGRYTVTVSAQGFTTAGASFELAAGRTLTLNIHVTIAQQQQQVNVQGDAPRIEIAPENNASAVSVSGNNLNALANDPDEFENQITALAGPSVGAAPAKIYINGLTGGDIPPKSAIQEIRTNVNPFSPENNELGYGRVDILTRPGNTAFHGDASAEYNDSRMNSLSPFLAASEHKPPSYHTWLWNADLGGPLGKNASFYFNFERRNINRDSLVNTQVLDANLNIVPYIVSVPNPRTRTGLGPRADFQLSSNNTLSLSYQYYEIAERNDGVDAQSLPSQAYDAMRHHHNLQVVDSQVLSARIVNQTSFQYLHFHNSETPQDFSPTINVLGAFTGGGDSSGSFNRYETHYTFQNYTTTTLKDHTLTFGGTLLVLPRREVTNGNFNGTFTFNSLADYQQTLRSLQSGLSMAEIQAAGYGPSQFSITAGNLSASINRIDGALFANDDWKISQRLTVSYGLRFESENYVSEHADWAPRVGIAWGLGRGSEVKTVLRAGWGIFHERLDDDPMIIAARLNGRNQRSFIVNNPGSFPDVPPLSDLTGTAVSTPTIFRFAPNLRTPYTMDAAVSLERQLSRRATVSFTYLNSRGVYQFVTNDINAPLPGTFNPDNPKSGVRPLGKASGNIYQYESAGVYRQTQLVANIHANAKRVSLFGYYVFDDAHSNSGLNVQSSPAGEFSFQTNPWNLWDDYGRAAFDFRHRVLIGGSFDLPLGIRLSPMIMANSGEPFSILLPQDVYGTGIHAARPAFATASTPVANRVVTKYGVFDNAPGSLAVPVPPNTETGPTNFIVNVRLSRSFGFGREGSEKHGGGAAPAVDSREKGLGGRGLSSGGGSGLGGVTKRRYALTISVSALNALNRVNLAPPVNVLGSPLFGQSIAMAGGAFSAQVGNPVANRLVNVGLSLSF